MPTPSKTPPPEDHIPLSSLTKNELYLVHSVPSPYGDPVKTLERKIAALAHLLNCDEAEATHVLLHSL